MITTEQIKETIDHFKEDGLTVRVRDVAFALLAKMFSDNRTAYRCLFGGDEGYGEYANDDIREKLTQYLTEKGFIKSFSTDEGNGGISFEENRKEMEALLQKTQDALEKGIIEPKDAFKIMADIRVKLNDKFKVEAEKKDRMIVVEKKYNHICSRFGVECYLPTKEDLMEMYNLIEKPNTDGRE